MMLEGPPRGRWDKVHSVGVVAMIDGRGGGEAGNRWLGEVVVEVRELKRVCKQGAAGLLFATKPN